MTPEERAAAVLGDLCRDFPLSFKAHGLEDGIARVAAAVRAAEADMKERCAVAAETHPYSPSQMNDGARDEIAAVIRSLT